TTPLSPRKWGQQHPEAASGPAGKTSSDNKAPRRQHDHSATPRRPGSRLAPIRLPTRPARSVLSRKPARQLPRDFAIALGDRWAMNADPSSIVVVDDEEANREGLARRLQGRAFAVTAAKSGQMAIELLGERRFDLVLLDIMMPGMTGLEVLK